MTCLRISESCCANQPRTRCPGALVPDRSKTFLTMSFAAIVSRISLGSTRSGSCAGTLHLSCVVLVLGLVLSTDPARAIQVPLEPAGIGYTNIHVSEVPW